MFEKTLSLTWLSNLLKELFTVWKESYDVLSVHVFQNCVVHEEAQFFVVPIVIVGQKKALSAESLD
jgi:hypothetical protein